MGGILIIEETYIIKERKKMKKRVLSLVMSTAMVASVLTACGSSAEAPATDNNAAATETKTEAAATAATATTEAAATEE